MRAFRFLLPALVALLNVQPAFAGDGNRPATAYHIDSAVLEAAPALRLPKLDRDVLAAEDALADGKGRPWRFARPLDVMVSAAVAGR